jgi:Flp pilus assembly protein TadG
MLKQDCFSNRRRKATAAVEFAVILPVLLIFLTGAWEVGRMLQVQNLLDNAVRDGARQASTGNMTASQVQTYVAQTLNNNGLPSITASDVTVTNLTTAGLDPASANQLDKLQVAISIPFDSVRWILLNKVTNVTNLTSSAVWFSMRDVPLAVNATIPLN